MVGARRVMGPVAMLLAACSLATSTDGLVGSPLKDARSSSSSRPDSADASINATDPTANAAPDAEPYVPPPATCTSATTQCVTAPPAGWTGPFQVYDGAPATAPVACPSPQVNVVTATANPTNPTASCTPCSCGTSNVGCAATTAMQSYENNACSIGNCAAETVATNTCTNVTSDCSGSVRFTAPAATATCTPSGGAATVAPPAWQRIVLGCKAPGSALQRVDCSADQVCAPKPAAPFESKMCVVQDGDVACPAPYIDKRLLHEGFDDSRGCSACTCNAPNAPCEGGLVYTGPGGTCTPTNTSISYGGCYSFANLLGSHWRLTATPPPGISCTAVGGTAVGALTPTNPITVCCM